jgi:hypothetical protein
MAVECENRSILDGIVVDDLKTNGCLIQPIRIGPGRVTKSWSKAEVDS